MRPLFVAAVLFSIACGGGPTPGEIDRAKARTRWFLEGAEHARRAGELLDLAPAYTCGESRDVFIAASADALRAKFPCATVTREALDDADRLRATFPEQGCRIGTGTTFTGRLSFIYSGDSERFAIEGDFGEASEDGRPLQARAGYGRCEGDERHWVVTDGTLSGEDRRFHLGATLTAPDGAPVLGSRTLVLDGGGDLLLGATKDAVTFTRLTFRAGQRVPDDGLVELTTSDGHRLRILFNATRLPGGAELVIDEGVPVAIALD